MRAVSVERRVSACGERSSPRRRRGSRSISARPEREREEVRRQLIMLVVGGLNMQRDRKLIHVADEFDFTRLRSSRKRAARSIDKRGHSKFREGVGKRSAFDESRRCSDEAHEGAL